MHYIHFLSGYLGNDQTLPSASSGEAWKEVRDDNHLPKIKYKHSYL